MAVRSAELTIGRTFGVTLDDGDDFFASLNKFCLENNVKYGYIPSFIGALRHVRVAGSCSRDDSAEEPMFHSWVDLDYVEALGAGTIAFDHDTDTLLPHVHISIGKRMQAADGLTSHLFAAEVQFLLEMVVVEVTAPSWTRPVQSDLFDLKLLRFDEQPYGGRS